jgi:hypothetical protein
MKPGKKSAKAAMLGWALAMLVIAGCAGGRPAHVQQVPTAPGYVPAGATTPGAQYCDKSRDGSDVSCGGGVAYCQQSPDGTRVSCGAMATYCEKSRDGKRVACGGRANYCEKSGDGKRTACGGAQN